MNRCYSLLSMAVTASAVLSLPSSCSAFTMTPSPISPTRRGMALKYQSSSSFNPTDTTEFYFGERRPQEQPHYQWQNEQQEKPSNRIQGIFLGEDSVEAGYKNLASLSNIFSPKLSYSWTSPTSSWPASHSEYGTLSQSYNTMPTSSTSTGMSFPTRETPAVTELLPASTYSPFNQPQSTFYAPPQEQETTGMFQAAKSSSSLSYQPQSYPMPQPTYSAPPPSRMTTTMVGYNNASNENYGGDMYYASRPYAPQYQDSGSAAKRWHERQQRLTRTSMERQDMMLTMNAFDHINYL